LPERNPLQTKQLLITEPKHIEFQDFDLDENLNPSQSLMKTEYSVVSAGTEGSRFTALDSQMPGDYGRRGYPQTTEYGNLGKF
jgi:hypothetical protein